MKSFKKKVRCFLVVILSVGFNTSVNARTLYVAVDGDDNNNGKTEETAFRSLQKAADVVQPGDVVYLGNGDYTNDDKYDGGAVLRIHRSGKPNAWISWKALPGTHPTIRPVGWAGVSITASYEIIDGITILGANDSINLLAALTDAKNKTPNPLYNTNGITIDGRKNSPYQKPHHIIIKNSTVGKCPGGGITILEADYVIVEDCKVFENAWYMRYAGSGITTLNNWAFDDSPGYHMVIQRNYVWDNKTLVPWEKTGKLSDGNGILIDVTDLKKNGATNPNADVAVVTKHQSENLLPEKQKNMQRPEWKGRALIANNLSAFNGGSGIHVFRTKYVDIINNTTYWNGQTVGYQELFANNSEDIIFLNNIIVPRPGGKVTSNNKNKNIRWDYNLYPNEQQVFKGEKDIIADPLFIKIDKDLRKANFKLSKNSKGINSGIDEIPQPYDIQRTKRPKKSIRDRGAFEQ
ncbi:right-handed parallel beta-helix repeat-containing protein [Pedobacter jamesrossensis]|uniref:Right-handed parallel beta-helix repeat-containing protein n=1 Tax=Pedobacter jamesrossensis TaxID=1908238 RepID=A0ABV8NTK2_9SPHI